MRRRRPLLERRRPLGMAIATVRGKVLVCVHASQLHRAQRLPPNPPINEGATSCRRPPLLFVSSAPRRKPRTHELTHVDFWTTQNFQIVLLIGFLTRTSYVPTPPTLPPSPPNCAVSYASLCQIRHLLSALLSLVRGDRPRPSHLAPPLLFMLFNPPYKHVSSHVHTHTTNSYSLHTHLPRRRCLLPATPLPRRRFNTRDPNSG